MDSHCAPNCTPARMAPVSVWDLVDLSTQPRRVGLQPESTFEPLLELVLLPGRRDFSFKGLIPSPNPSGMFLG